MCLDKITNENPTSEGVGYTVLCPDMRGFLTAGEPRPEREWINEKDYRPVTKSVFFWGNIVTDRDGKMISLAELGYSHGWHLWKTKRSAKKWPKIVARNPNNQSHTIRKVRYRKALKEGTIRRRKCVVAKEIFIL